MIDDNKIHDIFNNGSLESEDWLDPSDVVFDNIENGINEKPKKPKFIFWLFSGLSLVILLVAVFVFYPNDGNKTISQKQTATNKIAAAALLPNDQSNTEESKVVAKTEAILSDNKSSDSKNNNIKPIEKKSTSQTKPSKVENDNAIKGNDVEIKEQYFTDKNLRNIENKKFANDNLNSSFANIENKNTNEVDNKNIDIKNSQTYESTNNNLSNASNKQAIDKEETSKETISNSEFNQGSAKGDLQSNSLSLKNTRPNTPIDFKILDREQTSYNVVNAAE